MCDNMTNTLNHSDINHYITWSSFTSLSNRWCSKQLVFIGFQLLLRQCRKKAAGLWSVCSPLTEISICFLQMPGASTTRSLSALRLWAGRVEIISHSKCSWKHLDIQLSIYSKCVLCSLQSLLICLICFLTGNQKCLCRGAPDSQLCIKNHKCIAKRKKRQYLFSLFPLKETDVFTTAYFIGEQTSFTTSQQNWVCICAGTDFWLQSLCINMAPLVLCKISESIKMFNIMSALI